MKLYGFPPTRSIRVLSTLRELDVEFEFVNVDPTKGELRRPEFLAVNPAGKLPVTNEGVANLNDEHAARLLHCVALDCTCKHPRLCSCVG